MLKPLHVMLKASLLHYKPFVSDVKEIGCVITPYDACVANKTINNKQHELAWQVDDVKPAHVSPKENEEFAIWYEENHGKDC